MHDQIIHLATSIDRPTCLFPGPDPQYCMVIAGSGVALAGLHIIVAFGTMMLPVLRYLMSALTGIALLLSCVVAGWGIYFFFQHHDRMLACDRTIRIFTEVLFYISFVGMCLLACILCCVLPVVMGAAVAANGQQVRGTQ